jgi:hypothetical protein
MLTTLSAHGVHPPRRRTRGSRRVAAPPREVPGGCSCQNGGVTEASHSPSTQRVNQPGREEAVVRAGEHPVEHERPEEWGWHGETGKWGRRLAVIPILVILAYLVGNHEGRMEDLWLLGIALVMVIILIADARRRKNAWRSR